MGNLDELVETEFLIIGSGIAGLSAALELANNGKKVVLVTKSKLTDSNTYYAQGGISAVDPKRVESGEDSFESHIKDTLQAGAGICDPKIVEQFVKNAYSTIEFMSKNGVKFSVGKDGQPILHQEGGHEHPRIYCVGDYTGRAVEETLAGKARENPNITILENHSSVNLITHNKFANVRLPVDRCLGAYVLDRETGEVRTFHSKITILATGGAGRAFQYTSNPENATGDGIAMAYRAGARVANMEFFQFHPTVLYVPNPKNPSERRSLLTEALRGRAMGGILTTDGHSIEDFVKKYDQRGSHATRDIVARAIDTEIKKLGLKHVYLNVTPAVTHKSPDYIREHFPDIFENCLKHGIDITKEPIPVIPAAHYTCGGVVVDEFGRTDISGLYAVGEVACTGLMGANRLASNSLSEGALYGRLAVQHALASISSIPSSEIPIPLWSTGDVYRKADPATLNQLWDTVRGTMTNLCGIDRNEERLQAAVGILTGLTSSIESIYVNHYPSHEIMELRNLVQTSRLIAEAALNRRESRGGHYRADYPLTDPKYQAPTIIHKDHGMIIPN